jgi:hypothetical protein
LLAVSESAVGCGFTGVSEFAGEAGEPGSVVSIGSAGDVVGDAARAAGVSPGGSAGTAFTK